NPSAQISVIDTNFSGHFTFSTKAPGADANAMVERVRISAIGNVGIGTTTPGQKLDVRGAIVSSATTYPNYAYNSANRMAFGETNVPANETGSVVQYGSGSNTRNMLFAFTKTGVNTSYFGNDGTQMMLGSESTTPITFRTGLVYSSANVMASGTEVMRLTSAGLLGIGTAAPATALHVVATTNPLTLFGVQAGTSTTADSLLTITSGLVRKLPMSTFISTGNAWALGGNTVTTAKNLGTIDNNDLPFITNNTEKMRLGATGNLGVGSSSFNATNPEKLLVQAGATTSFNLMQGHGKINNYLQLNIQNDSAGTSASSDLVATADNGNESVNFIDMGINSSANSSTGVIGGANNAYLYGTGNDFSIGNSTSGKNLLFFTGGTASSNEAMRINGTGQVGIGTSAPATALHVVATTNPLTLIGVQTGTSTTADSLLTITSGLIRKLPMSTFLSTGNAWALGGNTVTTIKTLGTIDNNHLPFITNNVERMRISNTGNLGIGASSFNVTNPEKLLVQAGTTTSFNLIQGHGKINSYLQLNIQNDSAGVGSSSDLVATADDGNEAVNYVDLGINSSVNTSTGVIGGAHTAYLYGTGNDFSIGNASSGKSLLLFTGGTNATNERMRIDSSGKVGIGTTTPATALHVVGTNPLTLVGVQTGTSTSADSVLTITSGLVRKLPMSTFSFSAMTAGSIPFIGTGGGLSQNNANLFWDATNNRLGIGTNTPGSDFTLYQSTGVTSKGFRFTGNSVGGTSSGSGFTMALGFNQTNNKQLWLGDPDYLGNSAATFIRYSSSNGTTIFDAISGDNNTRRSIRIGYGNDALSTVILGDDGLTATPGSYVWANGSMAIGNGYRANSAPNNGLIVQGNVGIGTTTPTAALHLPAGTATANTAPLKFTSGTNLTTPENGAVEFNGTHFYGTVGSTRYQLDQQAAGSYTGSNGITLVGSDFRNNLTTGVSGGQTATGGTAAGNSLTLSSTTNATKGKILFGTSAYDEVNNRLGIATASPSTALAVNGTTQLGALGNTITNVLVTSYNTVGTTTITLHSGTDITATIPAVSGTNGTVQVSFAIDLPSAVIVAWARVISTTSVKIHLVNCEGTTQTIASGTRINLTIIE
ncbi:MAG TPA: hypothetical protein VNS58_31670, partial [Puia sp.]|nr:hypothetical protein [Puia sp.]